MYNEISNSDPQPSAGPYDDVLLSAGGTGRGGGGDGGDGGLDDASDDADNSFGDDPASSPAHTCGQRPSADSTDTKSWIEFQLVDEDGKPVPGEKYRVKTPDGTVCQGTLDGNGLVRVTDIDPGTCEFTFPYLDQDAWTPADE